MFHLTFNPCRTAHQRTVLEAFVLLPHFSVARTLLILTVRYVIVDLPEYVRSSRIGCQLHIQYTTLHHQGNSFRRTSSSELIFEKKDRFVVKTLEKRMATDGRSVCLWFQRAGEDVVVLSTK